ncbi:MAG: RNA polymerase sigma factor, partial [Ktedonobacterales bacterium]
MAKRATGAKHSTPTECVQLDEAELLRRLARNVDGAFEPLLLIYQDRLYALALRLSGNAQDAEEIAQDTFVRAYRALGTYTPERIQALRLRPWLYQIALNRWRNQHRKHRLPTRSLDASPFTTTDGET